MCPKRWRGAMRKAQSGTALAHGNRGGILETFAANPGSSRRVHLQPFLTVLTG
jgi:hypothetical protein